MKIIGLYRRHAQAWANLRTRNGNRPALGEQKWLNHFLTIIPDLRVILDVGCGSGDPFGRYFLHEGYQVTGVDTSQELLAIAAQNHVAANWINADMRELDLKERFGGILAWDSMFHLTPMDQRTMFRVFSRHAAKNAALMFTSGPEYGRAIGQFEGEPLYHASLDSEEYHALLEQNGFQVINNVVDDPQCGGHTVWLAQFKGEC